jgi:hypothetical protein
MAELTNVRPIKAISRGGPVQGGHGVAFTVLFEDGGEENYYCRYDQLPMLVGNLSNFGSLAEQLLRGLPKEEVQVATPYTFDRLARSGRSDDGKTIALQIATKQGFPLQIAMTPDQAHETIAALQKELTLAGKGPPLDRRN